MARRHDDDDDLCRFERLNAVRALSGRLPIPPQPWRHRRTDHFDAELIVTYADAGFSGPNGSESGP
jgi:hypothetical protein